VRFPTPFRTLRGHLTLLACMATLPAFLFVVYVAGSERKAAVLKAESEARYAAELASREHAHQIAGVQRLLERLASIARGGATDELRAMLPPILSGFPQVANIGLLDAQGNVVYSVVPITRPVEMRDEPAFASALRVPGVAVGQYRVGKIVGRPVLLMANAVRDDAGTPRMVLFAALELAWLDELARQANVPSDTALAIADRTGTVLAASTNVSARAKRQTIDRFAELTSSRTGTVRVVGIDDVARLAVAAPLRGVNGFWVVVGSPEKKIQSIANRVFFRDVMVLALFAAFAIGASIFAADLSVLRDLRLLARATRRFGEGDLAARSPVPPARGEIREVTTAFNSMAAGLQQRHLEATEARETLRALTHRLQTIREDEARRIAQELHDELGQDLTVMKIELANLRRRCPDDAALIASIDGMDETVDRALHSVRRISSELRPGVLDRLGLTAALEWLLREIERHSSLKTELHTGNLRESDVDAETATALFRITQEALTNVVRHAHAASVVVELAAGEQLVLRIRDDGDGFDPRGVRNTALGLVGMRERAANLGGSVRIESAPGRGTEVIATMPRGSRILEDACIGS
jgi:signal transduction histidine kinase